MHKNFQFLLQGTTILLFSWVAATATAAQSLDRGFADLAKKINPGVVNISTYAHPRMQPGMNGPGGMSGDEFFRRFFEQYFGGMQQRRGPHSPPGDDDDDDNGGGGSGGGGPGGGGGLMAPRGPKAQLMALGTGFVIDSEAGLILTNYHVINGAEEVKVQFKEEDEDLIPAEIIGRDPDLDVALLKIKTKKLTALPLGDSDAIDVGEYVLAFGNPMGYGHTVSHGILSAKGRKSPEFKLGKYLQTDASINPGNSGGPLMNMRGEVIGINNAIDARAQGIGFAIPINLVKAVLPQLRTKGSVARGYLGVGAIDLTPEIAEQLKLDPKLRGVLISDIARGGPADKAGIKPYDVIESVNGEKIPSSQDLTVKITSIPIGNEAKIIFDRRGKQKTTIAKVTERPTNGLTPEKGPQLRPEPKKPRGETFDSYGFTVEELNEATAREFGIPYGQLSGKRPLIVVSVDDGSPAGNSGLTPGDLVLDVAGTEVPSIKDLEKALKTTKAKAPMLRVKRFDSQGVGFVSVVILNK